MQFQHMESGLKEIGTDLHDLGGGGSWKGYFSACAKKSVLVFVGAQLLWSLAFEAILEGLLFSLLCAGAALYVLCRLPAMKLEERARKIEKHLPFALMQLSVEQNIGVPFASSLERIAGQQYGEFSSGLGRHLFAARICGGSVPEALLAFAQANRSQLLRRAVSQMVSAYEHGQKEGAGEPLREMALELLARQKAQAAEFSARMATFSIAFVVVSAVVPALFSAYTIIGSSFMEIPFDAGQVLMIVAIVFPIVDIIMLGVAKWMTPEFLKG